MTHHSLTGGIGQLFWHIHHTKLVEPAIEPIENRIQYIRDNKPAHEIETRLRLLRPVVGKLPEAVVVAWNECVKVLNEFNKARNEYYKAWNEYDKAGNEFNKARNEFNKARNEYDKARNEYDKAWNEYDKAWNEYVEAIRENMPALVALHALECKDCPWNGKTIFPEQPE